MKYAPIINVGGTDYNAKDSEARAMLAASSPSMNYGWTIGKYITSTGSIGNDSHYAYSDMITVVPGDIIDFSAVPLRYNDEATTIWLVLYVNGVYQERVNGTRVAHTISASVNGLRFSFGLTSTTMTQTIIDNFFKPTFYLHTAAQSDFQKSVLNRNILASVDLNTITTPGCYLMIDTNTYQHSPIPAGFLLVFNAYSSKLQIAMAYNSTVAYMRRGNGSDSFNSWIPIGLQNFTSTDLWSSLTDANTLFSFSDAGYYLIPDNMNVSNLPTSVPVFLFCFPFSSNWAIQVCVNWDTDKIFIRRTATVSGGVATWTQWKEISGGASNTYNFVTNENTYNVTATPTITTDTNNYLAETGDTTDRTNDIITMLSENGTCHLGPGLFYIKDLVMPQRTSIIGSGSSTRLYVKSGDTAFGIKLDTNCTVSDLWLMGDSSITTSSTIGNRHGLVWQGTYAEDQNSPSRSMISNVRITSFTGGGILCENTGTPISRCIDVVNAFIYNCNVGIYIRYSSEFNKFTNVVAQSNYYGCINNGGNNIFVNCDFSGVKGIAFLIDNSQDQSPNNSHGSAIGCIFNHTADNTGTGIKVLNCDHGFVFDGCQVFYSKIEIEDSDGVIVSNSNFGSTNCSISVTNGGATLFANNMHQTAPTITVTNNSNVHFVNCYVKSTGAVVSN